VLINVNSVEIVLTEELAVNGDGVKVLKQKDVLNLFLLYLLNVLEEKLPIYVVMKVKMTEALIDVVKVMIVLLVDGVADLDGAKVLKPSANITEKAMIELFQ
jgi:hypothetical protein